MWQASVSRSGFRHRPVRGRASELCIQGPLQGCCRWHVAEKERLQHGRGERLACPQTRGTSAPTETARHRLRAVRALRGIISREALRPQGGGSVRQLLALPVREDRRGVLLEALSCHWWQIHALGTGDLDCVYHFALYELIAAVREYGKTGREDIVEQLETLVEGKRLKDISDLPLDLAC